MRFTITHLHKKNKATAETICLIILCTGKWPKVRKLEEYQFKIPYSASKLFYEIFN